MCRFHAKLVFEYEMIAKLDYYWRLDDDSALLKPIKYDVFKFMRDKRLHYGYTYIYHDSEACIKNLWESTQKYINESNINATFFDKWPKSRLYYNNFEIASTEVWLSDDYRKYIEFVDHEGGIFYHRWGDAPIHSIAVALFLQENQIHQFNDIGYRHGDYFNPGY